MRKSERLMKAEVRPGMKGRSAGGSRLETWFDMKMQALPAGTVSRPVATMRMPPRRKAVRMMAMAVL